MTNQRRKNQARKSEANKIAIDFNKKFYSRQAIKKTISAYSQVAPFEFLETEKYFRVIANKVDKSMESAIRGEFSNYALALMQE